MHVNAMRTRAVIYASKVAACANMHPYIKQEDLSSMFMRFIGAAPAFVSAEERGLAELNQRAPSDLARITAAMDTTYATPGESVAALDDVLSAPRERERIAKKALRMEAITEREVGVLAEPLGPAGCTELVKALEAGQGELADIVNRITTIAPPLSDCEEQCVRSAMYTRSGTVHEADVRSSFSQDRGVEVTPVQGFRVASKPFYVTEGGAQVFMGGRHDGVVVDGSSKESKIIEIKTRQRRFLGVPVYDRVQVHAYMHIYGVRRASLVESFDGEIQEHDVPFDDDLWSTVCVAAGTFVEGLLREEAFFRTQKI